MGKKGYWMVMLDVTDAEGYQRYREAIGSAVSDHGGRYLVRGGQVTNPEGCTFGRHVVVEFDSYQAALDCYNSLTYQAAREHRLASSKGHFAIVEGA